MWKDSYLIGIEKIDAQHKLLFEMVEDLREGLKERNPATQRQLASETISFLKGYCIDHFRDEEEYLMSVNFSDYENHKQLHHKLVLDVLEFEEKLTESNYSVPMVRKFLGFVTTWLVHHVAGEDLKFATLKGKTGFVAASTPPPLAPHAVKKLDVSLLIPDFATKSKNALRIITGMSDRDINHRLQGMPEEKSSPCFKVGLNGSPVSSVGFIYSGDFTAGVVKALIGLELEYLDELAYSILQEISNIIGAGIAEIFALKGIPCQIDPPKWVLRTEIPAHSDLAFTLETRFGDVKIIIFT